MTFDELLAQIQELLQREQRLSYRALKVRFQLDDDHLAALKEELIYAKRLAVDAVLTARIDRLPPEDKRLLQTAAVIGTEVPLPLLQAIAERPEAAVHGALAHLQAAEFLYETRLFPEHEYTFMGRYDQARAAAQRVLALAIASGEVVLQALAQVKKQ